MTIKLKKPSIPYTGWTIESDINQKSVDLSKLALHLEPEQEKGSITGTELRTRMQSKSPMSASVLDYLIEHPEDTPEEWKQTKDGKTQYVFFWGTIYCDSHGNLYVRYWYCHEGRWQADYDWLDNAWDVQSPSVVLRKDSTQDSVPVPSLETLNLETRVEALEAILKHHNLGL